MPSLVALLIHLTILSYLDLKPSRQGIDNGSANSVQTSRYLVSTITELTTRMEYREYNLNSRYSRLRMNTHRNSSSIIPDCSCAILIE